jgi:hypothetical protein
MPFKSQRQRAWMYANKPEMARRWEKHTPRGRLPNPVEALEELTGNQMLLLLLGVGIVGGGIYYLATRPAAAAAPPASQPPGTVIAPNPNPTLNPSSTLAVNPNAPLTPATVSATLSTLTQPVIRPTAPNTFAATIVKVPAGPSLTVAPFSGVTKVLIAPGDYMTLTLPSGGRWNTIAIGQGQIDLSTDMTSPVSIPLSSITALGATTIVASWTDGSGASQNSLFAPTAERVLHL